MRAFSSQPDDGLRAEKATSKAAEPRFPIEQSG
jgi:hypothetical protein